MANRFITYGYKIKNGYYELDEKETLVVKRIFKQYIDGLYFQQIANSLKNDKIVYFDGKCEWSKRKVARIIENKDYLGNERYPAIIEEDVFRKANIICSKRRQQKLNIDDEIKTLKSYIYCEQCGSLYNRKGDKIRTERWYCPEGCYTKHKLTDSEILNSIKTIVYKVYDNVAVINGDDLKNGKYKQTSEIIKYNNEIEKELKSKKPNFNICKQLIFKCVALKFKQCSENKKLIYYEKVIKTIKKLPKYNDFSFSDVEGIIERIFVTKDGKIKIRFINNAEITE